MYARRDWPRRHGAHSQMLTGVLPSAFRLWCPLFPGFFPLLRFKNKKTPYWEFFCFNGTRTGIGSAATALIRKCSSAYSVRLSLVVAPFFQCSLPYCALKTEKLPIGSFFVLIGTRAGIRTLDPLIKSQLL